MKTSTIVKIVIAVVLTILGAVLGFLFGGSCISML